jgi:hypothetical protein
MQDAVAVGSSRAVITRYIEEVPRRRHLLQGDCNNAARIEGNNQAACRDGGVRGEDRGGETANCVAK